MNGNLTINAYTGDNQIPLVSDDPKQKRQTQKYHDKNGNLKEREKKRNGIIGTSPKDHIEFRRTVINDIMLEHPDYTGKEIRAELLKITRSRSRYHIPKGFKVPSYNTIMRDLKEMEWRHIKQKKKIKLYEEDEFQHFSRKYGSFIRQVRIHAANQEYLFYPITDDNSKEISTDYYSERINNIKKEIIKSSASHYSMVHLFIILSETGFEDFLCRLFKRECENVLYTSTHNYCAEIVLECVDLDDNFIISIYTLLPHNIETRLEYMDANESEDTTSNSKPETEIGTETTPTEV